MSPTSWVWRPSWARVGSEDEVIAALLHDAIEDTDATYTTLADRFDKPVADIVRAYSDTDVTPKPAGEAQEGPHSPCRGSLGIGAACLRCRQTRQHS